MNDDLLRWDRAGRLHLGTVTDLNPPCCGCGMDVCTAGELYMVHDHVWAAAGTCQCAVLCVGCLEARLGRQLTAGDFSDWPVNDPAQCHHSDRLRARLAAKGVA